MGRNDNYPDDIRMYDHDPRSPFYKEPSCPCGLKSESDCNDDDECGEPGQYMDDECDGPDFADDEYFNGAKRK